MAYGIFRISKDGTVILSPDAIKLCRDLAFLTDDQIKYIVLVYDYVDSPIRRKPLEERRRIARDKLSDSRIDPEDSPVVKKGIEEYTSMIYDNRRERMDILNNKISRMQKKLDDEEDDKIIKRYIETINLMSSEIDKLQEAIDIDEEMIEVRGNKKLTFIEIWKRNMSLKLNHI